ncbi:hypothetical protein HMPREF0322_00409 [Desulfitobacterium hafniense DP7]|uniref:DUF2213 domain-containing protein n=1 Tax=Desulfitobacterium hafniense DP7 TaxID=537010 RepID=G9XHI4_DESHA|nr:hypothetical protein HMPREF0322_00409 [Desulfitobacterium hafniense DP7]
MPLKAFYGSRFSPNMTRTPEGFLICHNVPIGRTGWLEYLGQELGIEDKYDVMVKVHRSPDELFSPAAMASFEGKPVTDDHPSSEIRADNYSSYTRGTTTNVRQGAGEESDCLVADLVIYDPKLISEVENGKREVSCGYTCNYVPIEGTEDYKQISLRGNHVAVVDAGRAGARVAIKDHKPIERSKAMKKNTLFGKMLKAFAIDASPEELAEASKLAGDESPFEPKPAEPPKPAVDEGEGIIGARLDKLEAAVGQILQALAPKSEANALDALENELSGQAGQEESVTIPVEQIDANDEAPVSPPNERPENPIPGADRNAMLTAIRTVKPIIAAMKDPSERKQAADALAKTFRSQMAQPATQTQNGYAGILAAQQANAAKIAKDSKAQPEDMTELGKKWAKQYNPHYKEGK